MILCVCNNFSDKKASKHMQDKGDKVRVAEVYSACSGGNSPQCCTCLETLKDMVKTHNKSVTA